MANPLDVLLQQAKNKIQETASNLFSATPAGMAINSIRNVPQSFTQPIQAQVTASTNLARNYLQQPLSPGFQSFVNKPMVNTFLQGAQRVNQSFQTNPQQYIKPLPFVGDNPYIKAVQNTVASTPYLPGNVSPNQMMNFKVPGLNNLPDPVKNAFPITQLPTAINTVGRFLGLKPNAGDLVFAGLSVYGAPIISQLVKKYGEEGKTFIASKQAIQDILNGKPVDPALESQYKMLSSKGLIKGSSLRGADGVMSVNYTVPKGGKLWDMLRSAFPDVYYPSQTGAQPQTSGMLPAGQTPQQQGIVPQGMKSGSVDFSAPLASGTDIKKMIETQVQNRMQDFNNLVSRVKELTHGTLNERMMAEQTLNAEISRQITPDEMQRFSKEKQIQLTKKRLETEVRSQLGDNAQSPFIPQTQPVQSPSTGGEIGGMKLKINDKQLKSINDSGIRQTGVLSDVIDYPDLFNKYPEFKNIPIVLEDIPGEGAHWDLTNKKLVISPASGGIQGFKENILHELQHAVQQREGMPTGGNHSIGEDINKYLDIPGEIQSRDAVKNGKLTFSPSKPKGMLGGYIDLNAKVELPGGKKQSQVPVSPQIQSSLDSSIPSNATSVNPQASKVPLKTQQTQPKQGKVPLSPQSQPVTPSVSSSPTDFNTSNLNVSKKAQTFVDKTVSEVKPQIEKVVGKRLSNKEAKAFADVSAKVLSKTVTREETLAWESKMLKARELLSEQAQEGTVTQEYLDNLMAVKSQGTDIARKLQSLGMGADPNEVTAKQAILEAVMKVTQNADEILAKSQGVDFNNYEQAASFYRQFVKPTAADWFEKVRYSSMLSSPNTHINNFSSNLQGTGIIAPIEKTITGGVDALLSAMKPGRERKYYAGEGIAYTKGYVSKTGEAYQKFIDTMTGKNLSTTQEMFNLPLTEKGTVGRKVEDTLSFVGKALQAADEFFQTLTEGGVTKSLEYRQSKGAKIADIKTMAYLESRKRLFNSAFGLKEEGPLLQAIEYVPMKVAEARNSKNPVLSTIAKFSFPFVRVPSNVLKASVEYGPLGLATIPGAKNKEEQFSKALLGSIIGVATATMVAADRMTWAEPTDPTKKAQFRAAHLQPYAFDITGRGDWVSYSKLHPAIAFNMALVAAVRDSQRNKLLDDGQVETVLNGVAKWVNFYADMSYVKNIGDATAGIKGDLTAGTRQIGNYVQQAVPFRALMGWVTRIVDPYQRQIDPNGNILEQQLQSLMTQIPGLSGNVPTRNAPDGTPLENQHRFINAVSPMKISTEDPAARAIYESSVNKTINNREETVIKQKVLDTGVEQTYNGKRFYKSTELDTKTGERVPVVKSIKVPQSESDIYNNLPKQYETSPDSPKNIIEKIGVYGTGIFKDPGGTMNAIMSGQPIRKVNGDAVVVERLKNLASLDQGDKATEVDHVIPIALGGDNSESNLAIISKQDNRAKGVVDTYLSNELKAGRITQSEAQKRDLNWRQEAKTLPVNLQSEIQKIQATPIPVTTTNNDIVSTLASRQYKPIYNGDTYSDVQVKVPELPQYTGMTELDKQLKSKYTSQVSTAKTNIAKLYLDGQITAQEANSAIQSLTKSTGSGTKKVPKPTLKSRKMPKVKALKAMKSSKIKVPKLKAVKLAKVKTLKRSVINIKPLLAKG